MGREQKESRVYISQIAKDNINSKCKGKCMHCGKKIKIGKDFTVEHFIPLSKGGVNSNKNLVGLCEECNKDKANDVIHPSWYQYAPKLLAENLREVWDEYITNEDWLTTKNLLAVDRMPVRVVELLHNPRSGIGFGRESMAEMRKVRKKYQTVDYLQKYKEHVDEKDRSLIIESREDVDTQFYYITLRDKIVMFFSLELTKGRMHNESYDDSGQNVVHFDIFINPENNWGESARSIVSHCIDAICAEMVNTIRAKGTHAIVPVYLNALFSDKAGREMVDIKAHEWGNFDGHAIIVQYNELNAEVIRAMTIICGEEEEAEFKDGISTERLRKIEKRYRSQINRRIKQNEKTC